MGEFIDGSDCIEEFFDDLMIEGFFWYREIGESRSRDWDVEFNDFREDDCVYCCNGDRVCCYEDDCWCDRDCYWDGDRC